MSAIFDKTLFDMSHDVMRSIAAEHCSPAPMHPHDNEDGLLATHNMPILGAHEYEWPICGTPFYVAVPKDATGPHPKQQERLNSTFEYTWLYTKLQQVAHDASSLVHFAPVKKDTSLQFRGTFVASGATVDIHLYVPRQSPLSTDDGAAVIEVHVPRHSPTQDRWTESDDVRALHAIIRRTFGGALMDSVPSSPCGSPLVLTRLVM